MNEISGGFGPHDGRYKGKFIMKLKKTTAMALSGAVLLSACAHQPVGPTIAVMPAQNKPFQVFQQDQATCKAYADQQTAGAADAANERAVGAAVVGTAIGAALGAAVGGGRGAAIGAAGGAAVGTGYGAQGSSWAQLNIQQRYNVAYGQCMYSYGNQVPGFVPYAYVLPAPPPPPPPGYIYAPPPPPPGYYPPPPPPPR